MGAETFQGPILRKNSGLALAGFLAATFLVAGISTLLTTPSIPTWYAALAKPSFNPPNQIFGPVWALLYALMALAAWLVWKRRDSELRKAALLAFGTQLFLNFCWSALFFGAHQVGLAALEILLLWLAIAVTMACFFALSKAAGWMLVPYLAWVSFASVLNIAIWRLN